MNGRTDGWICEWTKADKSINEGMNERRKERKYETTTTTANSAVHFWMKHIRPPLLVTHVIDTFDNNLRFTIQTLFLPNHFSSTNFYIFCVVPKTSTSLKGMFSQLSHPQRGLDPLLAGPMLALRQQGTNQCSSPSFQALSEALILTVLVEIWPINLPLFAVVLVLCSVYL